MEGKEARHKLLEIFGKQIMLNKDFDSYVIRLKEGMLNDFIDWCKRCKENKEVGSVPQKKEFKHLYIFFRKVASDDTRLKLGYKKSSYYGS